MNFGRRARGKVEKRIDGECSLKLLFGFLVVAHGRGDFAETKVDLGGGCGIAVSTFKGVFERNGCLFNEQFTEKSASALEVRVGLGSPFANGCHGKHSNGK